MTVSRGDALEHQGNPPIPLKYALMALTTYTFQSLEALIDAAKQAPGSIPAAASGSGSIHHLNLLAIENGTGAKFKFIPYKGSAPGQEAAMAGEVALVVTSLAEQAPLIAGNQLRPLAMLTPDAVEFGDVSIPSAFDLYDGLEQYLPLKQAIGFAVHESATDDVKATLTDAFDQAIASDVVAQWAQINHYDVSGKSGADASAVFANLESNFAWTLWDLEAAKVNPETLGIAKP